MNSHKLKWPGATLLGAAACLLVLAGGCSMLQQTNEQLDEGAHAPGRARDMGIGVGTTSNINQINMQLSMAKSDNDGKPPATLEDAKKAAKNCPPEMWIDKETGKPLVYDPVTGTVHRDGAAADSPPVAGSPNAPGGLKGPNGGAGAGGY
jgi:hypothetical protein